MPSKTATLLEVAKLAGVSTATINRVLKQQGYVSEEAREKVLAAVAATNYRPNVVARNLRTQRSQTIGLMLTAITVNPIFVGIAHAVEAAAIAAGYRVVIFNHGGSESYERHGVETFIAQRVDAVLFCTAASPANVDVLEAAGIPAIEIERALTETTRFVRVNNYIGARAAIDHLVGLGHQRIAFVGGDPILYPRDAARRRSVEEDRLDGYRDGMAAHGLPIQPDYVRLGQYYDLANDMSGAEGRAHATALLALPTPPSAIFATCDILAVGVMQALYQAGKRVPHDMSVVGFDDTLAAYLAPQLTTVAQPLAELGRQGFDMAVAAIENRQMPGEIVLDTNLVIRQSTGPARGTASV